VLPGWTGRELHQLQYSEICGSVTKGHEGVDIVLAVRPSSAHVATMKTLMLTQSAAFGQEIGRAELPIRRFTQDRK
jgi:hypothetical protein